MTRERQRRHVLVVLALNSLQYHTARRERDWAGAPFQAVVARRINSSRRSSNLNAFRWFVWDFKARQEENDINERVVRGSSISFELCSKGKRENEKTWRPTDLLEMGKVLGTKREFSFSFFQRSYFSIWRKRPLKTYESSEWLSTHEIFC